MKKRLLVLPLCALLLVTTACGKNTPTLKDGKQVVASVEGKDFTAEELYEDLKGNYGYDALLLMIDFYIANEEIEDSKDITDYAQKVVDYYKEYAEYNKVDLAYFLQYYVGIKGVTTEEDFKEYVTNDYKRSLAILKYIGDTFTDEEIKTYYDENYSDKLTVKHILLEFDENTTDDKDEAYEKAVSLIAQLNAVKDNKEELNTLFEKLAKEYSADSSYANGGLIDPFVMGDVVTEFWDASNALSDNTYTATPVKTKFGYHIILKVGSEDQESLEDAKEDIKSALAEKKSAADELLQYTAMHELRKKYKLTIYDTDLDNSYKEFVDSLNE